MRRDIASRSGAMGHVGDDRSSPAIPRTTRQFCGPKGSKGWNLDAFVGNQTGKREVTGSTLIR